MSLADYIGVKGKYAKYLPHTAGRYQKKRFRKAQVRLATTACSAIKAVESRHPHALGT